MAIRDANRPVRDATEGCADRASVVARREAEVLFWRSDGGTVVLGHKAPAPVRDGGCFSIAAVGTFHKVRSAKADGCMADRAAYFACRAADEVG